MIKQIVLYKMSKSLVVLYLVSIMYKLDKTRLLYKSLCLGCVVVVSGGGRGHNHRRGLGLALY